jgi:hypothetical protein
MTLASHMLVAALIRRVQAAGGFATIVRRGDRDAGAILVQCAEKGATTVLLEPRTGDNGTLSWAPTGPASDADPADISQYFVRRAQIDPDIWILELDIAQAAQFAVETLTAD